MNPECVKEGEMTTKGVRPGDKPFFVYIGAGGAVKRVYPADWDHFVLGEFREFPSGGAVVHVAARDADLAKWVAGGWWLKRRSGA